MKKITTEVMENAIKGMFNNIPEELRAGMMEDIIRDSLKEHVLKLTVAYLSVIKMLERIFEADRAVAEKAVGETLIALQNECLEAVRRDTHGRL